MVIFPPFLLWIAPSKTSMLKEQYWKKQMKYKTWYKYQVDKTKKLNIKSYTKDDLGIPLLFFFCVYIFPLCKKPKNTAKLTVWALFSTRSFEVLKRLVFEAVFMQLFSWPSVKVLPECLILDGGFLRFWWALWPWLVKYGNLEMGLLSYKTCVGVSLNSSGRLTIEEFLSFFTHIR